MLRCSPLRLLIILHGKMNNEVINGVLVRRFGVKKPRSIKRFGHLSMLIDKPFNMHILEDKWVDSQGPYCPELIEYIKANKDKYDVFVFMTYLYYTTVRGIKMFLQNRQVFFIAQ